MVLGGLVWLAFHESGIHATIAGVLLGFMTPARSYIGEEGFSRTLGHVTAIFEGGEWSERGYRTDGVRRFQWLARETISPLEYLEHSLHPWASFMIIPIFALANAGVPFDVSDFTDPVAIAVMVSLFVGKPVGIFAVSYVAVRTGLATLPAGVTWSVLSAAGFLVGIGFTMSLFISGLALDGDALDAAKVGVLLGSLLSAIVGMGLLYKLLPPAPQDLAE